jgi:hypothetical protein
MDKGTGGADPQLWTLRGPYITVSALHLTGRVDWWDPGGLHIFICNVVISLLEPLLLFCSVPNLFVVPSERQAIKKWNYIFFPEMATVQGLADLSAESIQKVLRDFYKDPNLLVTQVSWTVEWKIPLFIPLCETWQFERPANFSLCWLAICR